MRSIALFLAAGALAAVAVACAGVADLDVKYSPDAGGPSTSSLGDASLAPDAAPSHFDQPIAVSTPTPIITTCPGSAPDGGCDTTAGLGCCLSGGASCMSQADYATSCPSGGVFVGCFQPTVDAECCWHEINGSRVALAGTICSEGYACLADSDCPDGTGKCAMTTCHGVTIGQCGGAPACP